MQSILLVEDNKLLRLNTQRLLVKAGYRVLTAEDGEEALATASTAVPDVILLDLLLPKLDGSCVLAKLKADPVTAHIPVLVLTGLSSNNEDKLRQAGALAFVEKSRVIDNFSVLLDAIIQVLPPINIAIQGHAS